MATHNGYAQGAKLPSGAVVLSGMVGVDASATAYATLDEQLTSILRHITEALAEAGAKAADVYKIVSYHIDMAATTGPFIEKWAKEVGTAPTWTAVGVRQQGVENAFLEVQVEAWPTA